MKAVDWRMRIAQIRAFQTNQPFFTKRIGVNSAWLVLARVAVQSQSVLLAVLAARRLSQAEFGQYSLIASLVFLANVLTTFGTDTLLIRQVARKRRADIPEVNTALYLQLLFSGLVILGIWLWVGSPSGRSADFTSAARLYSLSLLPLAFTSVFSAILRGLERMDHYLASSLAVAGVQIAAVWLAFEAGSGLPALMAVLLAVQAFAALLAGWMCMAYLPPFGAVRQVNLGLVIGLIRAAWPIALISILGVAYQRLGVFTLGFYGNDANTGLFSAAARIIEALKIGHIAVLGALLPALSRAYSQPGFDRDQASRLFRLASGFLVGLGLALSFGLVLGSGLAVNILYGVRYGGAVGALHILAWVLVPYSLSSVLSVDMVARGQEKGVTFSLIISLAGAVLLNWLLIPAFGLAGACFASLSGECVLVGCLWVLKKKIWN